ncbi:MAG TPA: hypothetical protein VN604_10145, partial [Nitrospirota bacterium]|nr:hypothetical protein [Nitrospirota bacterium]
ASGNVVFEQSVPEGTVVWPQPIVSNNGTVALITEGRLDDPQREDKLLVYDQSGMELLAYPRPGERALVPLDISKLSSNGRYLAVRVDFGHREGPKTVFFDLVKPATRKADQVYVVYDITDGGLVTADYFNREKREIISVKIHLKNFLGGE